MGIAYGIKEAAQAASIDKAIVVCAIQSGELVARRVGGEAILLRTDIQAWLERMPAYLDSRTIG